MLVQYLKAGVIELVKGQQGFQGGDGGTGGIPGKGGNKGYAYIYDLEHGQSPWTCTGKIGNDGKPGKGGYFGDNLKVWYYQNQWDPAVRHYEQHKSGYQYLSHSGYYIDTYVKAEDGVIKPKKYYSPIIKHTIPILPKLAQSLIKDFAEKSDVIEDNIYYTLERPILDEFMHGISIIGENAAI